MQKATLENENGTFTFVRGEDGAWTLANSEENSSRTETLRVGAQQDDGGYVVKWSDAAYFVTVHAFSVEGLLTNGRDAYPIHADAGRIGAQLQKRR